MPTPPDKPTRAPYPGEDPSVRKFQKPQTTGCLLFVGSIVLFNVAAVAQLWEMWLLVGSIGTLAIALLAAAAVMSRCSSCGKLVIDRSHFVFATARSAEHESASSLG